jgi:hypothetical protein
MRVHARETHERALLFPQSHLLECGGLLSDMCHVIPVHIHITSIVRATAVFWLHFAHR